MAAPKVIMREENRRLQGKCCFSLVLPSSWWDVPRSGLSQTGTELVLFAGQGEGTGCGLYLGEARCLCVFILPRPLPCKRYRGRSTVGAPAEIQCCPYLGGGVSKSGIHLVIFWVAICCIPVSVSVVRNLDG